MTSSSTPKGSKCISTGAMPMIELIWMHNFGKHSRFCLCTSHPGKQIALTACIEQLLFFGLSLEGGLEGLPLRVSNEGLPRPRVARAQEAIKLHLTLFQTPTKGSRQTVLHCARRTSTF